MGQIENAIKDWTAPIYAFFHPRPTIGYKDGRRYHAFSCMASKCRQVVRRYLDTSDRTSTSNLHRHVQACWGEDVIKAVKSAHNAHSARENVVRPYLRNGTITDVLQRIDPSRIIPYSHRQHTRTEMRYVCIHCSIYKLT